MGVEDFSSFLGGLRAAEGEKSGMIYVKSTLVGLLAVFVTAVMIVVVGEVYVSIAFRSSQTGAVGWDPISLAKPWTWLAAALAIFLVGFFWKFFRLSSK